MTFKNPAAQISRGRSHTPIAIAQPREVKTVHAATTPPSIKLNLGCGHDYRDGWVNVDINQWHRTDIICDVTWLKPIVDLHADHVLAQDILEHIPRTSVLTALTEWNRVLRLGGTIEVRVPDLQALVKLMDTPEYNHLVGHEMLIQSCYGTQSYTGDFHLAGFTELTLRAQMEQAGFRIDRLDWKDQWLFECYATKIAHMPPNPLVRIEDPEEFLRQAYRKVLKREPDPGGFAFFHDLLVTGTPREAVLAQLNWAARHTENEPLPPPV
jgi:hypothetical protein